MSEADSEDEAALLELTARAVDCGYLASAQREMIVRHCQRASERALTCSELLDSILLSCPVVIDGLNGAPELNGRYGRVTARRLPDGGRYPVEIEPADREAPLQRAVRLANLRLPEPTQASNGTPPPTSASQVAYFTPSDRDDAGAVAAVPSVLPPSDGGEERCCRICMSDESEVALTSPCACRGSLSFACTDCVTRGAVAAWEGGATEPMRCKQCMQEYNPEVRLEIARAQARFASAKLAEEEALEEGAVESPEQSLEREERVRLWRDFSEQQEINLSCVALLEYGRWLGHASAAGMEALKHAEERVRTHLETRPDDFSVVERLSLLLARGEACRYSRRLDEAEAQHRFALAEVTRALEAEELRRGPATLSRERVARLQQLEYLHEDTLSHLGNGLVSQGASRLEEAETLLRRSLELSLAQGGRTERRARDGLARCLSKRADAAKLAEAEELARWSCNERKQIYGREHAETAAAVQFMGSLREKRCCAAFAAAVNAAREAAGGELHAA